MDDEAVTDLILRAIAAMRERGELPEFEHPAFTVTRQAGEAPIYRSNAGDAIAAAQADERHNASDLARIIADYLAEVVDLVPAYSAVRSITASEDGTITIIVSGPDKN